MTLLAGDREPIPYPPEDHLVETLDEIAQIRAELERLDRILA